MPEAEHRTGFGLPMPSSSFMSPVFPFALLGALLGGAPMSIGILDTPAQIVVPLALSMAALFAALLASWAGTYFAPDRTRTRLWPVVGVSMATAAIVALIVMVLVSLATPPVLILFFLLMVLAALPIVFVVPLSASWAAWRFRGPRGRMGRGAKLTLALAIPAYLVALIGSVLVSDLTWSLPWRLRGGYAGTWVWSMAGDAVLASVILGLTLALWRRFRRREDRLGMDAAITVGLVGLAPLIVGEGSYYVLAFLGVIEG